MDESKVAAEGALPPPHRRHFLLLDAGRGVAAIAVLIHHIGNETQTHIMRRGFLAVDYFLLLSGFVIALSYEPKLGSRLSFKGFMELRVLRLWPMIAAGGMLATLAWALGAPPAVHWSATILQFLLLPMIFGSLIFPLNAPLWSLFYETIANVLHAVVLRRTPLTALVALIAVLAAADLAVLLINQMWNNGFRPGDFAMAFARIMTGYVLGIILYRLHAAGRLPVIRVPGIVPLLLILAPMATPTMISERLVEVIAIGILFPLAVVMGISSVPGPRSEGVVKWLGGISYPLYTTHLPILKFWLLSGIIVSNSTDPWWGWVAMAAGALIAASLFESFYDAPIRTWLRRRARN